MSDRTVSAYQRRNNRSTLVETLAGQTSSRFDPDIWTAMNQRDNALIEDEILHGAQSTAFVYSIPIAGGKRAEGITVIGAAELASTYGGIHVTMVASLSKRGSMFISRSYPYGGFPGKIEVQQIPDLREEEDFFEVTIEVHDLKTGNKVPSSRRESRFEQRSAESMRRNPNQDPDFERPHLEQIAFSKAYRNGVCRVLPQAEQIKFKAKNLALGTDTSFVESVIDEKRSGVLRYAAMRAIAVDREAIEALTYEQIVGLSDAVKEGGIEQFVQAADALGIIVEDDGRPMPDRRVVSAPTTKPAEQTRQSGNGAAQTGNGVAQTNTEQREARDPAEQQEQKPRKQAAKKQDGPPAGHPAASDEKGGDAAALAMRVTSPGARQAETKPAEEVKHVEEPTGFDHYALDEIGEEVLDGDGVPRHFTDPREFALWYNDAFVRSANQEALKYNNADAREEAALDVAAKVILDAVDNPIDTSKPAEVKEEPVKQAEGPKPVALRTLPNGRTNWPVYANNCEVSLKGLLSDAEIDAWLVLNNPTYAGKAISARVDGIVKARRAQIAAAPKQDVDMEQAKDLIKLLDEARFEHDYTMVLNNPAVRSWCRRMTTERPDIRKMVADADDAARERIKQSPPQEAAGRQPDEKNPPGEDEIPWDRMGEDNRP